MSGKRESGNIRARLIDAGLMELLEHGSEDFSLRRVALLAQVSCAAPYRHFKDKDELIRAIIIEIRKNWLLLIDEIGNFYDKESADYVTELLVAGVRFWVAGENFAPFLSLGEIGAFDEPIIAAITSFANANGMSESERERLTTSLLSLMYGSVTLVISKRLTPANAQLSLRTESARLLSASASLSKG